MRRGQERREAGEKRERGEREGKEKGRGEREKGRRKGEGKERREGERERGRGNGEGGTERGRGERVFGSVKTWLDVGGGDSMLARLHLSYTALEVLP